MSKKGSQAVANLLIGLLLGAVLHWGWVRSCELRTFNDQVGNFTRLQGLAAAIQDFRSDTGEYPRSLADAVQHRRQSGGRQLPYDQLKDHWGHEVEYCPLSDGFVVRSPGRDGRNDYEHLCDYRGRGKPIDYTPCYSPDGDTILTEAGLAKGCAK